MRKVNPTTDQLTNPVGTGGFGLEGDGGLAAKARIVKAIAAARWGGRPGNLVITERAIRVRVVAASTGTFYGQAMTAG